LRWILRYIPLCCLLLSRIIVAIISMTVRWIL
jgi:hypothetical protein